MSESDELNLPNVLLSQERANLFYRDRAICVRPTVTVFGSKFYRDDLHSGGVFLYLAKKAKDGDKDAIEICVAMGLLVKDADGEEWLNWQTLEARSTNG